jgi:predicted MFS family arabinose efflux permease
VKNQNPLSKYQWLVVAILALTQFTVVLDFMVMSPLGDLLMKDLQVKPYQFGIVVSSYALAAGLSGFMTAGFADRFDRKRLLVFFYSGFIIGTLCCGLAHTYTQLVLARIFTGIFGGVMSSIAMAIVADLFSLQQRGRVMGFMQMGFGLSQILGIPISLSRPPRSTNRTFGFQTFIGHHQKPQLPYRIHGNSIYVARRLLHDAVGQCLCRQ